jgi:hypothetical protein
MHSISISFEFHFLFAFFVNHNKIIYRFFSSLSFLYHHKKQILTANINTYSEVENSLQPIIMAQKVRIYPYSQYDRTVCLRAELIGCIWDGEFRISMHFSFSEKLFFGFREWKSFAHERLRGEIAPSCCDIKLFNLIEETYAMQTFPVSEHTSRFFSCAMAKLLNELKTNKTAETLSLFLPCSVPH